MKKNDKILNYLSGRMTKEESILFDKELAESKELQAELELAKARLDELKLSNQVEVNELYFVNLLPEGYNRLDAKKGFWKISRLYYLVPTAAAIAVLFLLWPSAKNNFDMQSGDLISEVVNNISDKEVSDHYLADLDNFSLNVMISGNEESSVQIPADMNLDSESISKLAENTDREEYSLLHNLPDSELEKVYDKLVLKNSR
jgi:hypothetical protein